MKPISQIIKEGEKEFDNKFGITYPLGIKSHNRTQAKAILQGVIEMIENEKNSMGILEEGDNLIYEAQHTAYYTALTQVIEKLKEEISNL